MIRILFVNFVVFFMKVSSDLLERVKFFITMTYQSGSTAKMSVDLVVEQMASDYETFSFSFGTDRTLTTDELLVGAVSKLQLRRQKFFASEELRR